MDLRVIFFSLLPATIFGSMSIDMSFSKYPSYTRVYSSGSDTSVITETEREAFQLTDNELTNFCWQYFGVHPVEAFVNNPLAYRRHGHDIVERKMDVNDIYIQDIQSTPVTLTTREILNNGTTEAFFDTNIDQEVSFKLKIHFGNASEMSVGSPIRYTMRFFDSNVRINYIGSWNENTVKKWNTVVRSSSYWSNIKLRPGEKAKVMSTAMHNNVIIKAIMEADLEGDLICHFEPPVDEKKYNAVSVNDALEEANMITKLYYDITLKVSYVTGINNVVHRF